MKLTYDKLLSSFAFNCKLRHYIWDYLMFCMTGDTVNAPMGTLITLERDQSEFTRLAQLGDVLGLTQYEVGMVHKAGRCGCRCRFNTS